MKNDAVIIGQSELAVERFRDDTRHMIIFDVLSPRSPVGKKGDRLRLFLTDEAYVKAKAAQDLGYIRIKKHAAVIEGYILPNKKKKRRH